MKKQIKQLIITTQHTAKNIYTATNIEIK